MNNEKIVGNCRCVIDVGEGATWMFAPKTDMEVNMPEIRKQTRVDCDIMLNKNEEGLMNICRATNISLGGMRIQRLLEPFEIDSGRIQLEIELPEEEDEPLVIGARKVYEEPDHIGVCFTDISHRHFMKLRSWLTGRTLANELPMFR